MSAPLVSMIVPIHNHEAFAVETIESVCAQTHANLQIIVVDDGSTDNSLSIIREHFGERITLIPQANGGPSAAVNAGLKAAKGEYIGLLGGDDVCEPDRVLHQIEILQSTQHDIVFAPPTIIDTDGAVLPDSLVPVLYRKHEPGPSMFRQLFTNGNFLCAPSAMLRARTVQVLGLFHEGLIALQDYEYWIRACSRGLSLASFDHRVIRYRRHSQNLSSSLPVQATITECAYVLKRTLERALPEIVRAAFPHVLPPTLNACAPLTLFEKVLLLTSHPLHDVRQTGLLSAIELLDNEDERKAVAHHNVNLFQMLLSATHGR
ncbi:glycosyltransferase [Burkholderia sp. R-69980]|nr:glycosyltransferase [Burkholderia sp. R-69980]